MKLIIWTVYNLVTYSIYTFTLSCTSLLRTIATLNRHDFSLSVHKLGTEKLKLYRFNGQNVYDNEGALNLFSSLLFCYVLYFIEKNY